MVIRASTDRPCARKRTSAHVDEAERYRAVYVTTDEWMSDVPLLTQVSPHLVESSVTEHRTHG